MERPERMRVGEGKETRETSGEWQCGGTEEGKQASSQAVRQAGKQRTATTMDEGRQAARKQAAGGLCASIHCQAGTKDDADKGAEDNQADQCTASVLFSVCSLLRQRQTVAVRRSILG